MDKKLMMIGYGAMGREVHRLLPEGFRLHWVVVPVASAAATREQLGGHTKVLVNLDNFDERPDLVVECAGQAALEEHGEALLRRGLTLVSVASGALANPDLRGRLDQALQEGGGRLEIATGAIAGMDGLAAARSGGLDSVLYESCKAPRSWAGSHAETLIDLDRVTEKTVFYQGSAGEAARLFPANANVAATIALAGVGMEATQVRLAVDPQTERNSHRIHAVGRFGEFNMEVRGVPLKDNPKTSMLAALSVVRACQRHLDPVTL
ncbi:aspartate dehydrogenase [Microbulbifer discodermiae]|uniref:aspartate dehydrogenase n=1 Tax=Microbulbifer sp. 2201CG32-9 TaxID=3232309 RepID=UPI00345BE911